MKKSKSKPRNFLTALANALSGPGPIDWEGFDLITTRRTELKFDLLVQRLDGILGMEPGTRAELLKQETPTDLQTMYHVILERIHGKDAIVLFPGDRIEFRPKHKVIHAEGGVDRWLRFINHWGK